MQPSQPETDASPLNDFFYVDHERIGAYHTQLLATGLPTQTKLSARSSTKRGRSGTLDFKIAKGSQGRDVENEDASERTFDQSWPMILQTIDTLWDRGFIRESAIGNPVGSLIHIRGRMQIVDLRVFREIAEPMLKLMKQNKTGGIKLPDTKTMADFIKAIAQPLVAHIISSDAPPGDPWKVGPKSMTGYGVLVPQNVVGGGADALAILNGGIVPDEYEMIAMLDVGSTPDAPAPSLGEDFNPSNGFEMMLGLQNVLRGMFGRPNYANGVTPLVIYRPLKRALIDSESEPDES